MPTATKGKTIKTEKGHLAAAVSREVSIQSGPTTVTEKNKQIAQEREKGQAKLKTMKATGKGNVFMAGEESGAFAWLIGSVCAFFKLQDVGYKKLVTRWDFPKDLDDKKHTHQVMRQFYYQIDGQFLMVDAFDEKTSQDKINLIKAWMEALGFRYTYLKGGDQPAEGKTEDERKKSTTAFNELVFVKRLAKLDPKGKDYPKFKVPDTYREAGFQL